MSTEEFFTELEKVRAQFDWTLSTDAVSTPRTPARKRLRGVPRIGPKTPFDPLGAVCYARTGKVCGPTNWPEAGETLGMTPSDSAMLFAASNDQAWNGSEGARTPLDALLAVRVRLIETVDPTG